MIADDDITVRLWANGLRLAVVALCETVHDLKRIEKSPLAGGG